MGSKKGNHVRRSTTTGIESPAKDHGQYPAIKLGPLSLLAILLSSAIVPFNIVTALSKHSSWATLLRQGLLESTATIITFPKIISTKSPHSIYTSKEYATTDSQTVLLEKPAEQCQNPTAEDHSVTDAEVHEPTGQHLLVDIDNVDPSFLADPVRLAQALLDLVEATSLTMLSYHCHSNERGGHSCVGVLLESHVAVHSWPLAGFLALDVFTCGSPHPLLPLLALIQRLFAIPGWNALKPRIGWGHKRRGFRFGENQNAEDVDYHQMLGSTRSNKDHILQTSTKFQAVSILDVERTPGITDRLIFLDSILQSRRYGEAAYHEALVHPAMMTHPSPKRVAIIGGGEGATLREVLKHNTVEEVVMIEIDEELVSLCREHLPEWNDCSDIGGASSCFEDPRTTVFFEDAISWFIEKYSEEDADSVDLFDVIIMDSLDPNSAVEFSDVLFGTSHLVNAFSVALGDDGVFIAQVGEIDDSDEPGAALGGDVISTFIELLEDYDFESITQYQEAHGGFSAPWEFLLAMKNNHHRSNWFMTEAEMQLEIHDRVSRGNDGEVSLRYFDGATFMSYQFPSRPMEDVWCRDNPESCRNGHGFDPDIPGVPLSAFEVAPSEVSNGGRGVRAKQFIPKGTFLGIESCVNWIFVPSHAHGIIEEAAHSLSFESKFWDALFWGYIEGYTFPMKDTANEIYLQGLPAAGIEPSLWSFVNHGCNGTYSIGTKLHVDEKDLIIDPLKNEIYDDENDAFNPFDERHFPAWGCHEHVALRDIQAGEEILDNYLVYGGSNIKDWISNALELKNMCSGGLGVVTEYENRQMPKERSDL